MAFFDRDSLITSMMLLPVDSTLARGTLTTLAAHLGTTTDPVTEEQPGRVPHELRFGPAGTLALGGRNAYHGSADATPLFVMALGQLAAWAPDLLEQGLVQAADQALEWMLHAGDRDGDGLIEYQRATPEGLVHQGCKDSWDGIGFADGTPAQPPIALVEVQAYAYAAFRARADIADLFDDDEAATRRAATRTTPLSACPGCCATGTSPQAWAPAPGSRSGALGTTSRSTASSAQPSAEKASYTMNAGHTKPSSTARTCHQNPSGACCQK